MRGFKSRGILVVLVTALGVVSLGLALANW